MKDIKKTSHTQIHSNAHHIMIEMRNASRHVSSRRVAVSKSDRIKYAIRNRYALDCIKLMRIKIDLLMKSPPPSIEQTGVEQQDFSYELNYID